MRKITEMTLPESCLNKARPNEMIFILLGRDEAAPVAIRAWAAERIRLGKNIPEHEQIVEALSAATLMEFERTLNNANEREVIQSDYLATVEDTKFKP